MAETERSIGRLKASPKPLAVILSSLIIPVVAAFIVYKLELIDPTSLPFHELPQRKLPTNGRILTGAEFVGVGKMIGPEEIVYDSKSTTIYTGSQDGWIKRITVLDSANDSVVEDWVQTGGRPLGIALGSSGEVIVADAFKGLLKISGQGKIELLADEADGVGFKLADGVDIAEDGVIYFTDASYKYDLLDAEKDIYEGKPYGRFMSYDPRTKSTTVLAHNLYFANGVAVSPNQDFVVFCETPKRRCRKYYRGGEKKGVIDNFIDNLPGLPDNIRYDGDGHFWIAIPMGMTYVLDLALRYPFIRKAIEVVEKYVGWPDLKRNGGVLQVDVEGEPVAYYFDPNLVLISGGLKIGDHLYCGSLTYPYIIRLNLSQYPAYDHTTH